jgi:hypothetical protein
MPARQPALSSSLLFCLVQSLHMLIVEVLQSSICMLSCLSWARMVCGQRLIALASADVACLFPFPGRHPGSSLPTLHVYGKNRPTGSKAPTAVHTLGSHGYSGDQGHPASDCIWAGGRSRLGLPVWVTLSVGLVLRERLWAALGQVQDLSQVRI